MASSDALIPKSLWIIGLSLVLLACTYLFVSTKESAKPLVLGNGEGITSMPNLKMPASGGEENLYPPNLIQKLGHGEPQEVESKQKLHAMQAVSEAEIDSTNSEQDLKKFVPSILSSLRSDQDLSEHNLMLLRELSMRIDKGALASELLGDLSDGQANVLARLVALNEAEVALRERFQGNVYASPNEFLTAMISLRKETLGEQLYTLVYGSDAIQISSDAYSGEHVEVQTESIEGAYAYEPNHELYETTSHEKVWQDRLRRFLEEYEYVEQAGLSGEDEAQMRQELLQRYFEPEDQKVAEQFLFQAHDSLTQSSPQGETE